MNKWQKVYCETYYNGKIPKTKSGKNEYEMLGNIKEYVKVIRHDGEEVLKVTEDKNSIPNGLIAVRTLASNLDFWLSKGYKITTF